MRRRLGSLALALGFAAILASLSLVVWRQSQTLEVLRSLESVRSERALVEAERWELDHRVQRLQSRGWVAEAAEERLGMRIPTGSEIIYISLEIPDQDQVPDGSNPILQRARDLLAVGMH